MFWLELISTPHFFGIYFPSGHFDSPCFFAIVSSDDAETSVFKVPNPFSSMLPKKDKYELATHTVKIRRTGMLSDVLAIWDLPG